MTTKNQYVYGWEIEGFGDYAVYLDGGPLRLGMETLVGVSGSGANYARGLADLPEKISTTCDVLNGHTTQSTMQILIDRIDLPDITPFSRFARLALFFFWHARPIAVARLSGGIDNVTTAVNIRNIAGEQVIIAGDIIYLGREAMAVTAVGGAAPNLILTVARGVLGTDAIGHELLDRDIFLRNPVKLDRKVTLWEYDVRLDTETPRWRGVVEDIELTDGTQVLSVTCRDLMGTFTKQRIARDRWEGLLRVRRASFQANSDAGAQLLIGGNDRDSEQVIDYFPFYPDVPVGFLPGTEQYGTLNVEIKAMCVEIDGIAVAVRAGSGGFRDPQYAASYKHDVVGGISIEISGRTLDADYDIEDMKAVEILVCDADSPLCYFKDLNEIPSDHPAIIILNILTSSGTARWPGGGPHAVGINGDYDWLPGAWGRAVPSAWVDLQAFGLLMARYPTAGLRARAGYIGAGDGNQSTMDVLADLAQAMGCFLYMTADAKVSVGRLADPGFGNEDHVVSSDDWAAAGNEGDGQDQIGSKPIYAISIECAQQGPGGKPGVVMNAGVLGLNEFSRYRFHAIKDKLDCTQIYGDPVTHTLTGSEIQALADVFRWRYRYAMDRLPQYRLRAVQGATLIMPGVWVRAEHPFFFDNATMTRGFSGHRCLVVGGKWDPKEGTQEIVIVDLSPASGANTLITPAWSLSAVTSNTVFNLSDSLFEGGGERLNFVAGATYQINLWTSDGVLRSTDGPRYATAYNSGTGLVTLSAQWTTGGGSPVVPAVGNVVRVALYDAATGWQSLSYTWLGDSNMQLGAANDSAGRWDV